MTTPNPWLPDVEIDPVFKERLRKRVLGVQQRQRAAALSFRWIVPALGLAVVLLLFGVSPSLAPRQQPLADLAGVAQALAAVEDQLAEAPPLAAAATSAEEAMGQAQLLEQQLASYIAKLNSVIALLEQLIERLQAAGHDARAAQQQLTTAKQRLAEAQTLAALPVQCLEALAATQELTGSASCDVPLEETRQRLGSVVGLLRTSVSSAKNAL